ncbi:lysis protein [Pseudomonas sp. GD03860]|uniref:lysis system i-spanin subunit Rz n=1 Tax=Pseudomonas TaxID=286 RepID=UPI002363EC45|nr:MULTISPECIES: lysis system i-spanin subunit Rz [Pseudomonas]MDD2061048.1 lysis protein [Pseudomonas putida]MDH0635439.1 lysis protein [Pseudomonas sp. GD03860]
MSRVQLGGVLALVLLMCALTWQVQGWRLGRQLEQQAHACTQQRQAQTESAVVQLLAERQQRQGLEQQLQASDQLHYQELLDAREHQARLRDRLATADLRLSVLVERDAAGCTDVPASAVTACLDHDAVRARLEPAHARRIIAITDRGDRGLIALRACQAYVRALVR